MGRGAIHNGLVELMTNDDATFGYLIDQNGIFGHAHQQRCDTLKCGDTACENLETFTWWSTALPRVHERI